MRLTNAVQPFERMRHERLAGVRDVADAYVDDFGTRVEPAEDPIQIHDVDIRRVLDSLRDNMLGCDTKNAKIMCKGN